MVSPAPWTGDLLGWYAKAKRDLPWRGSRDPYAVWISETMLQQTRVETVVPYYLRFLGAFPTVASLAEAPEEQVLSLWSGLGYYRRARMLHAAARRVVESHGGSLPSELEELRGLEGVGAYTAGAIASIAFGRRAAVVDGNVARVLARIFAIQEDVKSHRGNERLWRLAEELVPGAQGRATGPHAARESGDGAAAGAADPGDWNQALMELGATICLPRNPKCGACPVAAHCQARAMGIEGELPRSAPRRAPSEVRRVALVLASKTGVLLARRTRDSLFGGLWEPPGVAASPTIEDALGDLAKRLGADAASLEPMGQVTHVLTHRLLRVDVVRGPLGRRVPRLPPSAEYEAVARVGWPGLRELAQSRLSRRILEVANVAASGLL